MNINTLLRKSGLWSCLSRKLSCHLLHQSQGCVTGTLPWVMFCFAVGGEFSSPLLPLPFPCRKGGLSFPMSSLSPQVGPLASRTRHGALMPPETGPPVPLPLLGASSRTLPSKAGLQLLCVKIIPEPAGSHATRALGNHARSMRCKAWDTWGVIGFQTNMVGFFFSLKINRTPWSVKTARYICGKGHHLPK